MINERQRWMLMMRETLESTAMNLSLWITMAGFLGSASIASAEGDYWVEARDAAKAGDHKNALRLYTLAYEEPFREAYKTRIAHYAAISAVALRSCDLYKKWIGRTTPKEYPVAERGAMDAKCARSKPNDNPPKVEPTPEPIDPRPALKPVPVPPPATGLLIIDSNLSGVLASGFPAGATFQDGPAVGLSVSEKGFHLPAGKVTLSLPNGTHKLKMDIALGIKPIVRDVELKPGVTASLPLNWEPLVSPRVWRILSTTNKSYGAIVEAPKAIALYLGLGLSALGGGIALYSTCGANVNGSCNETWQQGLSYTSATILTIVGIAFSATTLSIGGSLLRAQRAKPFTDIQRQPLGASAQ